jgi:hypothetical protein
LPLEIVVRQQDINQRLIVTLYKISEDEENCIPAMETYGFLRRVLRATSLRLLRVENPVINICNEFLCFFYKLHHPGPELCHRLPRFDFRTFFRNDEE